MTIRIHNQLFISFLTGDVSVPTNVIIGIGVGSAVLSMAGILIVMVMMCVYNTEERKWLHSRCVWWAKSTTYIGTWCGCVHQTSHQY